MKDEISNDFEWVTPRRNAVDEALGLTEDPMNDETLQPGDHVDPDEMADPAEHPWQPR